MTAPELTLHGYFRSSAAYRVRIALNLKGLAWNHHGVHLLHGEHRGEGFLRLNPQGLVPALQDGDFVLSQSLAIIEYLDERQPEPPLLPRDARERALARAIAQAIACDIHPLNNLRVLQHLQARAGFDDAARQAWVAHWIAEGFAALETQLAALASGPFCIGATPTLADCCLVPQVFNAARFGVDLSPYPRLMDIARHCDTLDAFQRAHPARQPDTPT